MSGIEVLITTPDNIELDVPVYGELIITQTLRGEPSTCTFSSRIDLISGDEDFATNNGSTIVVRYNDIIVFAGYLFKYTLDSFGMINFTFYDDLRYLNNPAMISRPIVNGAPVELDNLLEEIYKTYAIPYKTVDPLDYKIETYVNNGSIFDITYDLIGRTVFDKRTLQDNDWIVMSNYNTSQIELRDLSTPFFKTEGRISTNNSERWEIESSIDSSTYNYIIIFSETNSDKNEDKTPSEPLYFPEKLALVSSPYVARWGFLVMFESITSRDSLKNDLAENFYD
jgi:hypothetical protein